MTDQVADALTDYAFVWTDKGCEVHVAPVTVDWVGAKFGKTLCGWPTYAEATALEVIDRGRICSKCCKAAERLTERTA